MSEISHRTIEVSVWASYHIFYHSLPCDQVLLDIALPAVRDLWSRQRFIRFFFIRFGEGGRHIRLRFLCSLEDKDDIVSVLRLWAKEFFSRREIFHLTDCVVESPFEPETQRYGGTDLLGHSLDFFCLTSAYVLQQTETSHGVHQARILALAMRALMRQALGFAADEDELLRLTAHAANGEWRHRSPLEERADREFQSRREDYVRLLAEEIELSLQPQARSRLAESMLTDGALLLNQQISGASSSARWQILSSQLHMTWNRMGIRNTDEVYLGRILWRTVRHIVEANDDLRESLAKALDRPRIRSKGGFETLIPASLAQLARPYRSKVS